MSQFIADQKEIDFILYEMFQADALVEKERFTDFSKKSFDMIIAEARKLASIYEGTDGIQAMDLLGRKLSMEKGMVFKGLLDEMGRTITEAGKIPSLVSLAEILEKIVNTFGKTDLDMEDMAFG